MSTAAQVLAVVIAAILVVVWVLESFLYRQPRLYPIFLTKPGDYDAVRLWTVNMGFYNLTTAVALLAGVVLVQADHLPQGAALIIFTAAQHTFMGAVLVISQPKLWVSSILQGVPAAVLLALALS
jgi:putative membrane protein